MRKPKPKPRLKRCPFCGSDDIDVRKYPHCSPSGKLDGFLVLCNVCDAMMGFRATRSSVVMNWNRRYG